MPTILCVDDEPAQLLLLQIAFENAGFEVLGAEDGRLAVRLAEEHQPDLILMDLMMPGLDGAATIARIKQLPACVETPILVLSAYSSGNLAIQALDAGAREIVPKETLPRDLIQKVNAYLSNIGED